MRPANHENQISYESFCQLGGSLNPDLCVVERRNGSYVYHTYHHVGYGQAFWRNDRFAERQIRINEEDGDD